MCAGTGTAPACPGPCGPAGPHRGHAIGPLGAEERDGAEDAEGERRDGFVPHRVGERVGSEGLDEEHTADAIDRVERGVTVRARGGLVRRGGHRSRGVDELPADVGAAHVEGDDAVHSACHSGLFATT